MKIISMFSHTLETEYLYINVLTKYFRDLKLKPFVFSKWSTSLPGVAVKTITRAKVRKAVQSLHLEWDVSNNEKIIIHFQDQIVSHLN